MTTIFLSLLCVLAFATSAGAECAWVLWGTWLGEEPTPDRAFRTAEACHGAISEKLTKARREGTGHTIVSYGPDTAQLIEFAGTNKLTILKCLPDSIDPRGPKGR
jgi:hypothetical protein